MAAKKTSGSRAPAGAPAPADLMRESLQGLFDAAKRRASHTVVGKIESTTENLAKRAEDLPALASGAKGLADGKPLKALAGAGAARAKDKIKETVQGLTGGGGGSDGGGKLKVTNIVETADVGVPIDVAYDQWTRFADFPTFMKKVEHVEQKEDQKLTWKAQIFWSHRTWESEIVEQVPDERIVWTSKADKGRVDGAVSFHELAPSLTRIVVVLAYHPQGLFERVGNVFRAQGRRARLELKHFQRHVMTDTVLHVDELEGWRGEIHDGEVRQPEEAEPDKGGDRDEQGERGERGARRRSGGGDAHDDGRDADRKSQDENGDEDEDETEDRDEARRERKPRRRSGPDDGPDQDRPAGKRKQRPARSRGSRAAEKAGTS